MHACRRMTEAARFREQKSANNRQLIVAEVQRFLRHALRTELVSYCCSQHTDFKIIQLIPAVAGNFCITHRISVLLLQSAY